jgi:hypothetical protein
MINHDSSEVTVSDSGGRSQDFTHSPMGFH